MKKSFYLGALLPLQLFSQQKNIDYYITLGLQNSPLLKEYQFQVESNKIDSQRVRASYGLQVNGSSTGIYAPVVKGWGYDGVITNFHTYNALVGISQIITGKEKLNNQYLLLQLKNLGLQNQGIISEQELRRSITQQYITTYGDMLQINFSRELLILLKQEETLLKKLTEKGAYKQTDYLSFLVTIQQQELSLKQLQIQYQNNFATLNYITGINDTAYTDLQPPALSLPEIPDLQQTVYYEQFRIDSLKIRTEDKQIDFSYRPRLSIFADGGYNSSFATTPYKNIGLSAGLTVTVPIYDGKQRKMQHQQNTLSERSRKNYQDFFSAQYSQQIAQLKQQLILTEQLIDQSITQINYVEGLIKAQRQQLVTGDIRITDYIIAISNYLNTKNIITLNTINKFQIINQINYWNRKL